MLSLNEEITCGKNGATAPIENAVAGNDYEDMISYVENNEKTDYIINKMLKRLSPLECEIIIKRFGLAGYPPVSMEVIASENGLSRERIRQILQRSLIKLKKYCPQAKELMD